MTDSETGAETKIETPCARVCAVHPTLRLCVGCGRSLDEIAEWTILTAQERDRIMALLPQRLASMRGAGAAGTTA